MFVCYINNKVTADFCCLKHAKFSLSKIASGYSFNVWLNKSLVILQQIVTAVFKERDVALSQKLFASLYNQIMFSELVKLTQHYCIWDTVFYIANDRIGV